MTEPRKDHYRDLISAEGVVDRAMLMRMAHLNAKQDYRAHLADGCLLIPYSYCLKKWIRLNWQHVESGLYEFRERAKRETAALAAQASKGVAR